MKSIAFIANLVSLLARLWYHLSRRRRVLLGMVVCLMLISAIAEVVSLGAVLPFLGILVAPNVVLGHPAMADAARVLAISSNEQLVVLLTGLFALAALFAGAIRILLIWVSTRLAFSCGADLSIDVYRRTLYQPYQTYVARNSSEVISGISNKVNGVVFGVLLPLLTLVSSIVLLVAIISTLIFLNPIIALVASIGFGGCYGLITWMASRRLHHNSQRIASEQIQLVKALQEGLSGMRDVLIDGLQPVYCHIYCQADYPLRRAQSSNVFIAQSPRYAVEVIGMVLIACLAYSLSREDGGIAVALPMLGVLVIGAQRLLPALQQSYSAWASIAGSYASLADTIELLEQPLPEDALQPVPAPLSFQNAICFKAVRFSYTKTAPWALDGINFTILKGTWVGFIGSTGSGKSTLLDLLMGLLLPKAGEILVDGQPISGVHVRAWQRNIAHVPQSIYLADSTLAENIAFGVERKMIDMERVKQVARLAQIASFIESRPGGYNSLVGERGVCLSGGQRQRIGIARALYKQASVLVLDEATSALDDATEKSVLDAIAGTNPDLTVLLIAHRRSSVDRCDVIIKLDHGRVVEVDSDALRAMR